MRSELWKVFTSVQLSTASLSFVASSVTAVMIARSRTMMSTGKSLLLFSPYHRIIFGLSMSDLVQSFAIMTGPFAAPESVQQALWGIGNSQSCRANGFLMVIGITATPMYVFMLCLYCLLHIKRTSTSQNGFPKRLEWAIHTIIAVFNLSLSIAGLATKSINAFYTGTGCGFAAYPTGCRQYPDIFGECDKTILQYLSRFFYISWVGVSFVCLVGVIVCMSMICWHVVRKNRICEGSPQKDKTCTISALRNTKSTRRCLPFDSDNSGGYSSDGCKSLKSGDCIVVNIDRIGDISEICTSLPCEDDLPPHLFCQKDQPTPPHGRKPIMTSPIYTDSCINVNQNGINKDCNNNMLHCREASSFDSENYKYSQNEDPDEDVMKFIAKQEASVYENNAVPRNESHVHTADPEDLMRTYSKEIMSQAFLFVLVFVATYLCWWVLFFICALQESLPSLIITFVLLAFYPLGGVCNILVYTRPKVNSFMRQHRGQYSWLHSFFLVIKAGGVVPSVNNDDSRDSLPPEVVERTSTDEKTRRFSCICPNVDFDNGGNLSSGDDHISGR